MSENGEAKRSFVGDLLWLFEGQCKMAALEWRYEKSQGARRLTALVIGALLALTAFVFLQVALFEGLQALGLSAILAAAVLTAVYGVVAAVLIKSFGRRDQQAGEPFEGTRQEMRRNIEWIRQHFS